MTEILLSFEHTGEAIRAESVLLAVGIPVQVMNLPSAIKAGCGICLRVAPQWLAAARACLRENGMAPALHTRTLRGGRSTYAPWEADND